MDMMAFTLVIVARQLRPYFQARSIKVLTDTPLKKVLQRLDTSGNWAVKSCELDIEYLPPIAVMGQVLADFVVEFASFPVEISTTLTRKSWQVFIDGSSCWAGGDIGVHIISEFGEEHNYTIRLAFKTINNEAEYEVLLARLSMARMLGAMKVEVKADSQVVIS